MSLSSSDTYIDDFRKRLPLPAPARNACWKTPKKCKKRGGSCVSVSSPCNTFANPKFCPGRSCTCCYGGNVLLLISAIFVSIKIDSHKLIDRHAHTSLLPVTDHKRCTTTPACSGGFCFKGKKSVCRGGKILRHGCKGKDCSCCLPRGSQGDTGGSSGKP